MKKTYKKIEEKLTSEGTELRQPVAELEAPATAQTQTGQLLQKTEVDELAVLNSISELVAYQDTEHRVIWTNRAAAESVGLTPERLVGRYCYAIWPQRSQPCEGCPVAKARQTGRPQKAEITTPDGRTWSIRGYPILDANDRVVGAVEVTLDLTERKKAEQALADEATRRRILVDQSLDGIVVIDENAKVYEANQKFAEMLGYTPEEVRELHTWDWDKNFPPSKLLEMGRNVDEKGLHLETKHHRKDGSVIDVDISVNGAVIAGQKLIFCVCRDVTQRKQAEEKLQTILKTALDGFYLADLKGKMLEVNDSYCKMTGYTREELLKMSTQDIEAIESPEETIKHIKRVMEQGYHSFESQHRRKDGKILDVEVSVNYLDVGQGQLFVFARDVTERKKAEQALRDSEEKMRKMFESVTDGISVVNLNSVITEVNQRTVEMHGFGSKDELVGKNAFDLVAPQDREKIARNMGEAIKRGTIRDVEYTLLKADGSEFPAELSTSALKDASGKVIGHITIARDITERKQAEEKLQTILKIALDGFWLTNLEGKLLEVNDSYCKMIGYNREELLEMSIPDLEAIESPDEVAQRVKRTIERGYDSFESQHKRKDGKIIDVEISVNYIDVGQGQLSVFARDITERKQAEQALQAEKNKLQSLIDALEDDLTIQDKDYNIIYQNEPSRLSSGGDHIGEKCYRAYEGRDKICDGCPVEKAFKDGKSHTTERSHTLPSGEVIFFENTANPIRDAGGKIVSCLEIGRNITERKKTEQALKESEEFSTSLLTNSPNPMLVINQDTSVRYANPALEKLTGFSPQEIIGQKAPYPWWTEETLKKTAKDLDQAMRQGARRLEELFQKKDGELFWVEITSTPVTSDGEFKYYLANWVDITERKRSEEREQAMQQELLLSSRLASIGELAAGVAHQINNPLTGVLGFSQRLLKKSADQETEQDLKIIYTEAERAAKVVQNLLTFARRRQPHKQYSDINEVLESALELRAYELKTSNIEVVTDLDPKLPEIMLDFYQIQEVFLNIILNAEQALTEAHRGGKLTIMTVERRGYVRTTFTDDGPGIPAESLDNIFDPFYTTKAEKGGTGLGLSVCHGIITEHGGKIYAKSKPGKGATFFVELPLTIK